MGEIGSRLQRAREARGLTLEDAERDTRISRRYLEALETEQFELIPAPVYARGFLRSYSQYLGMEPQEMLDLFPRDDDGGTANGGQRRASMRTPVPPQSASRPAWGPSPGRSPAPSRPSRPAAEPRQRRREPFGRPAQRSEPAFDDEPIIGATVGSRPPAGGGEPVIGAPQPRPPEVRDAAPTRRLDQGPAVNTKALAVLVAAVGVVAVVVLLAFLISNLGGDDSGSPEGTATGTTAGNGTVTTAAGSGSPTIDPTRQGVVPDVQGMTEAEARAAIEAAGFVPQVRRESNAATRGTVFQQAPAAEFAQPAGSTVFIVVSDGP